MALAERVVLIRQIEQMRGSAVICYLTSMRPNVNAQMAEDAVRVFFDHLLALPFPNRPETIDLFLFSSGGDSMVPWRFGALFRPFSPPLIAFFSLSAPTP